MPTLALRYTASENLTAAPREVLGQHAEVRVVAGRHRSPEALPEQCRERPSTQPRLGANRTMPSVVRTAPGTETRSPGTDGRGTASTSSTIWATTSTTWWSPLTRWWVRVRRSMISPPSPTMATAIRSTRPPPRPRHCRRAGRRGGTGARSRAPPRPPPPRDQAGLRSSAVRAPIVLRLSPSCLVSSARVVGPCLCTVCRMARAGSRAGPLSRRRSGWHDRPVRLVRWRWPATADRVDAGRHEQH